MGYKNVIVLHAKPFSKEFVNVGKNTTKIVSRFQVISCDVDPRYMVGVIFPPIDPNEKISPLIPPELAEGVILLQPLSSRITLHEDEINELAEKGITFEYKNED